VRLGMSDQPVLPLSLRGNIDAKASGSDTGALIASATGVSLVSVSLWFATTAAASNFAGVVYAGVAVGLLTVAAGTRGWFTSRRTRNAAEAPGTEVIVGDVAVRSNRIANNRELVRVLRAALQGRRPLPAPHGLAGGAGELPRAYTEDEKRRYIEEQQKRETEHDARVLGSLTVPALSATSDEKTPRPGRDMGTIGPPEE
jgi:hypothetical protein